MPRLSARTADLHASPIREMLAMLDRPGVISFAGGLPATATLPALNIDGLPAAQLQYGASEGDIELRARIAEELTALGLNCAAEQVLVLSGSQQGIDLVAKLFVDRGTPVAVEAPTYLAALQALRFFGASFQVLDRSAPRASLRGDPALLYVNPTFQNPTGHCYSSAERTALAWACDTDDITVFEDDPYRELMFEACDRTPICARLTRASWIYQGSFSKTLAPGLRLGYLACSRDLFPLLTRLKQAADLHSSRLSQWLVLRALHDPSRARRLTDLLDFYRTRRDAFELSLQRHFSGLATWQRPRGGLFFWLRLAGVGIDVDALLRDALTNGVAFMPGAPFFPDDAPAYASMRLNFSHAAPEDADRGLALLSGLVREALGGANPDRAQDRVAGRPARRQRVSPAR